MVYIHKETFDMIRTDLPRIKESDDYFEVDELIALPIQVLNRKGYITEWCCAGHPFPSVFDAFMENDPEKKVSEKRNPYSGDAYVSFAEGISLPTLPPGFDIDEFMLKNFNKATIRKYYISITVRQTKIDTYAFLRNVIETMEQLYEWALSLPDFKASSK